MNNLVRSYRDVWCWYHSHLESDWKCDLIESPYEYPTRFYEENVTNVTVTITKDGNE